jgi:hypothetical protein
MLSLKNCSCSWDLKGDLPLLCALEVFASFPLDVGTCLGTLCGLMAMCLVRLPGGDVEDNIYTKTNQAKQPQASQLLGEEIKDHIYVRTNQEGESPYVLYHKDTIKASKHNWDFLQTPYVQKGEFIPSCSYSYKTCSQLNQCTKQSLMTNKSSIDQVPSSNFCKPQKPQILGFKFHQQKPQSLIHKQEYSLPTFSDSTTQLEIK